MSVDPAFAAMLADPRLSIRPPPDHVPIARFREAANGFMAAADTGPDIHQVDDLAMPVRDATIAVRLYRLAPGEPEPVIVFVHGGGFVLGNLATHDALCRRLADASGCAVAAVDYRTAPEHPFPTPLDDVCAALSWIADHAEKLNLRRDRIALCGDSAGGYLAARTATATACGGPSVRHLALLYPVAEPGCASGSMQAFHEGYMLTQPGMHWFWQCFAGFADASGDSSFALAHGHAADWPPTSIATAEFDPLRDEGEQLADWLRQHGTPVIARRYPGMIHGFAQFAAITPMAEVMIADMAGDLATALHV